MYFLLCGHEPPASLVIRVLLLQLASNLAEGCKMTRQPALCCGEAIDPLHDRTVEPVTALRKSDSSSDETNSEYDRVVIGFRHRDVRHCRATTAVQRRNG
jgi:hypothetical protein